MAKYTDEDIRKMSKITCKIAGDYLGISFSSHSYFKLSLILLYVIFFTTPFVSSKYTCP